MVEKVYSSPRLLRFQNYNINFFKYFFCPTFLCYYFEEGSESVSEISGNIKGRVWPNVLNFESMFPFAADDVTVHLQRHYTGCRLTEKINKYFVLVTAPIMHNVGI